MKILGIIPARFASTRFPEKALANIMGKPMVQLVYEQAVSASCFEKVVVATDHPKIEAALKSFNTPVVMTGEHNRSGTDRCNEVVSLLDRNYDYVINIQGDEPFIKPEQINECAAMLDGTVELATLTTSIEDKEEVHNPNIVKVVFGVDGDAMYFSRHPVPYLRDQQPDVWLEHHAYYKHVAIYAYRTDILKMITKLDTGRLEKAESLEQLRWLENGYRIKTAVTQHKSMGIDTPADLEKAIKWYQSNVQ